MKEQINWITSAQANEYIYEWLSEALRPKGFILTSAKTFQFLPVTCCISGHHATGRKENLTAREYTKHASLEKTLARAGEHYIQTVCQEIRDGETVIRMAVAPMWTYRDSWCFGRYIRLKYADSVAYGRNNYTIIAYTQRTSERVYYQLDELARVWNTAILPQLHTELIDFYDRMNFETYTQICEEEKDKTWDFRYTDSESRFFTKGYNCLWKKQYEEGRALMEKAIREAEKYLAMLEAWGEQADSRYLRDMNAGKEFLEILIQREPGWEEAVQVRLGQLEQDVLELSLT